MKKVIEEAKIQCGGCNNPLALIIVSQTNSEREDFGWKPLYSKYRIYGCPNCGGSSFISKIFQGTTNIMPAKESYQLDFQNTEIESDGIITSKLSIRSKK